jgi:hypothetical protein
MLLPKFLSTLAADARTGIVGALAVSSGLAVLVVFSGWMGIPAAFLIAAILFAVIGLAWNQWEQVLERNRTKRLTNRSPLEVEHWVRDWLFKYKYQNRNDPNPEAHFKIVVTKDNGQKLTIVLPKAHPFVVIAARLEPDPTEEKQATTAILLAPDTTFGADLAVELAQLGVDYSIHAKEKLEVQVERKVPFDETITDLRFAREFLKVEGAVGIVFALAARAAINARTPKGIRPPQASRHDPKRRLP